MLAEKQRLRPLSLASIMLSATFFMLIASITGSLAGQVPCSWQRGPVPPGELGLKHYGAAQNNGFGQFYFEHHLIAFLTKTQLNFREFRKRSILTDARAKTTKDLLAQSRHVA